MFANALRLLTMPGMDGAAVVTMPPSFFVPAELLDRADQWHAQLLADAKHRVVGVAEEVHPRIDEKPVHLVGRKPPTDMILGLQEQSIDTTLLQRVCRAQPGCSPADYDDPLYVRSPFMASPS